MTNIHTPGPWRRFGGYMDGYGIVGDRKTIVRIVGDDSMDLDRHSADATLIAAAPELLEAAKWILRSAGYENGEAPPTLQELTVEVSRLDRLRAAISKAEEKG